MMFQIFSYFVNNAIVVNQIAVFVKFIIEELVPTVVKKILASDLQVPPVSALELQKKVLDAETEQKIRMVAVIYIKSEELIN